LEEWTARDPVLGFEKQLRELGLLDDLALEELIERIERELDQAQQSAEAAPLPDPALGFDRTTTARPRDFALCSKRGDGAWGDLSGRHPRGARV
jgi:TPP-dependent pyruvate/acetoin dehydrogenase alpha subunit